MDSPHWAVGKTSLAGDTFILVCLHSTSCPNIGFLKRNCIQILISEIVDELL
jgi:hypothetical protein